MSGYVSAYHGVGKLCILLHTVLCHAVRLTQCRTKHSSGMKLVVKISREKMSVYQASIDIPPHPLMVLIVVKHIENVLLDYDEGPTEDRPGQTPNKSVADSEGLSYESESMRMVQLLGHLCNNTRHFIRKGLGT